MVELQFLLILPTRHAFRFLGQETIPKERRPKPERPERRKTGVDLGGDTEQDSSEHRDNGLARANENVPKKREKEKCACASGEQVNTRWSPDATVPGGRGQHVIPPPHLTCPS
ncbi:hypothetical protein NL676_005138 [Syzygium grande]|nr:hypothetical protein NL676_005138 [Syzygium grande]